MKPGERIFVDTGAWIAAAIAADKHHDAATELWTELLVQGGKPFTSVPVIIETFTYLQRGVGHEVAQAWRSALSSTPRLTILDCTGADLAAARPWLERRGLHKLGLVDATSFVRMKRHKLRRAFTFDAHCTVAEFLVLRSPLLSGCPTGASSDARLTHLT